MRELLLGCGSRTEKVLGRDGDHSFHCYAGARSLDGARGAGSSLPPLEPSVPLIMFTQVNIEINTNCNNACRYCPVSVAVPRPKTMFISVFIDLLRKICEVQPELEWMALNHYGEPLLDPGFLGKVRCMVERKIPLRLFTNGTLLDSRITNELVKLGNVEGVVVNLPDVTPGGYYAKTGTNHLEAVLQNVDYAMSRLPVSICVNGNVETQAEELSLILGAMRERWGDVHLFSPMTNSRAGLISSPETRVTPRREKLEGCTLLGKQLNVDVYGNVFLCCQDYHKRYRLGNMLAYSLDDVLLSPSALELHGQVAGTIEAPYDMICRYCDVGTP